MNYIKLIVGFFVILFVALTFYTCTANAQVHVRGHYRSNGTYIQPHYRSRPDGIKYNNRSYRW